MNTREKFAEQLKAKIDEWDSEIEKLEARGRKSTEKAKQEIESQIAALKERRDRGSDKLEEIENATSDAWESLKIGSMLIWDEITDTASQTKDNFMEGLQSGRSPRK